MNKNTTLIACILSFLVSQVFAQDCGTIPPSKEEAKDIETLVKSYQNTSSSGITYLPVKLHLTKESGVTGYYSVSQFMYEFAKMNEKFLPVGFQFYLVDEVHYIDNWRLDEFNSPYNYSDSLALVEYNVNDAINLYYVNESNAGGRSNFITGDKFYNWMFVKNGNFQKGETLIHEMGHYFNLYHTFESFLGAELVNGSNCNTAGDLVCDTPADTSPNVYDRETCLYTGTSTDGNGQQYSPLMTNYMSYYSGGCITTFTPGQIARAQAAHASRLSLIASAGNQYGFTFPSNDTITVFNVRAFELNTQLKIRWLAYSSPVGFMIERSTSPNSGFVTIGGVAGYIREFSDPSYQTGQTYYYRIKAASSTMNYSPNATVTTVTSAYEFGDTYSNSAFSLRWLRFRDSGNLGRSFYAAKFSEDVNDLAANPSLVEAGKNFRISWETWFTYTDSFKVWIDLNQNRVFENTELLARGDGDYADDSLMIPSSTKSGYYRLRFRSNWNDFAFEATGKEQFGATHDFLVFIEGSCPDYLPIFGFQYLPLATTNTSIESVDYTSLYPDPFEGYPVSLRSPSITLNPGFLADGYNTFLAEPGGCP